MRKNEGDRIARRRRIKQDADELLKALQTMAIPGKLCTGTEREEEGTVHLWASLGKKMTYQPWASAKLCTTMRNREVLYHRAL